MKGKPSSGRLSLLLERFGSKVAELRSRTNSRITDEALLTYLVKTNGNIEEAVSRYSRGPWGLLPDKSRKGAVPPAATSASAAATSALAAATSASAAATAAPLSRHPEKLKIKPPNTVRSTSRLNPVANSDVPAGPTDDCRWLGCCECFATVTTPVNVSVLLDATDHFDVGSAVYIKTTPGVLTKLKGRQPAAQRGTKLNIFSSVWSGKGAEAPTGEEQALYLSREGVTASLNSKVFGTLGRMPVSVSMTLSPLLLVDCIRLQLALQRPETVALRVGEDLGVLLYVYITPLAFDRDWLEKRYRPQFQAIFRDCWEELLSKRLRLIPLRVALNMTGKDSRDDTPANTGDAAFEPPLPEKRLISRTTTEESVEGDDEEGDLLIAQDSAEGEAITAATFGAPAEMPDVDVDLTEMLHAAVFRADLRKYQCFGVYWMMQQENHSLLQRGNVSGNCSKTSSQLSGGEPGASLRPPQHSKPARPHSDQGCSSSQTAPNYPPSQISVPDNALLHPLWSEYEFADGSPTGDNEMAGKQRLFWFNPFTGELTIVFPRATSPHCGGILADEMGLGKTVQTIGLIAVDLYPSPSEQDWLRIAKDMTPAEALATYRCKVAATERNSNRFVAPLEESTDGANSLGSALFKCGTLLVVPLSLLSQWKSELSRHLQPDICKVFIHQGSDRPRDCLSLAQYDVILTSYGTVASEFRQSGINMKRRQKNPSSQTELKPFGLGLGVDGGGGRCALYRVTWHRIVLDEAHLIKNANTVVCRATCALVARSRWCLTGTPVQNSVEDLYSYIAFLRVSPWASWVTWKRCVSIPLNEHKTDIAVKNARRIVAPLLLRRTKDMRDSSGRPIVELPPREEKVIELTLSDDEAELYTALFRRATSSLDAVTKGNTNLLRYTHVLEMLLRLRQGACHPFLPFAAPASRLAAHGVDPAADMGDLVRRYLSKTTGAKAPLEFVEAQLKSICTPHENSTAAAKPIVSECPICCDIPAEPALLPCAHILCYGCANAALRSSSKTSATGHRTYPCPFCRTPFTIKEIALVPSKVGDLSELLIDESGGFRFSTKLQVLREMLLKDVTAGRKAVVFSQWTTLLKFAGVMLNLEQVSFKQFDGSLSLEKRAAVVDWFYSYQALPSLEKREQQNEQNETTEQHQIELTRSFPGCVLLVSLKAGGVGLNLTCATRCYLLDHWWNKAVEDQAVQRVHRLGQTQPVEIYRLVVLRTVEQRIMELQASKAQQATSLLEQHKTTTSTQTAKLSFEELLGLFKEFDN